jgi:predicted DNA binding protein
LADIDPSTWNGTYPCQNLGRNYCAVHISDAGFTPSSLVDNLTIKQRNTLQTAYRLGYFEVPRRIDSSNLAKRLGVGRATLNEHLRKAERRLLAQIMVE